MATQEPGRCGVPRLRRYAQGDGPGDASRPFGGVSDVYSSILAPSGVAAASVAGVTPDGPAYQPRLTAAETTVPVCQPLLAASHVPPTGPGCPGGPGCVAPDCHHDELRDLNDEDHLESRPLFRPRQPDVRDVLGPSATVIASDGQPPPAPHSRGARLLASDSAVAARTRHIHRRWYFVAYHIKEGRIALVQVKGALNRSNFLTKAVGGASYAADRDYALGVAV